MTDPYVGRLAFFRVYSGTIEAGKSVLNSTKGQRERLGRSLLNRCFMLLIGVNPYADEQYENDS